MDDGYIIVLLNVLGTVLVLAAGFVILATRNWRVGIIMLSVHYLGGLILVAQIWPFELAVIKLVAGWMAAAVLGSVQFAPGQLALKQDSLSGAVFRLLLGLIAVMAIISLLPAFRTVFPFISPVMAFACLFLAAVGLLRLGLSTNPAWVILCLLLTLSGFELFYAVVENSVLVIGMLAVINLGLGLLGAYFQTLGAAEQVPQPNSPGQERQ